jgi:hypothetical protein
MDQRAHDLAVRSIVFRLIDSGSGRLLEFLAILGPLRTKQEHNSSKCKMQDNNSHSATAPQGESYFMLEIDRGEIPIERYKNLNRTYFAKKMLTYYEANRQRRHVHDLGIENFRVETMTTTSDRVEKMLEALRTITDGRGSNMFLFTDEPKLAAGNPLDIEWVSGKGELVRLTD